MEDTELKFDTLLRYITPEEIDYLIQEEKLRKSGWNIHYIVDSHEIRTYCFPFGLAEDELVEIHKYKTNSLIADEQMALRYIFFNQSGKHRPCLLDEYIQEIRGYIKYSQIQARKNLLPLKRNNLLNTFFSDKNVLTDALKKDDGLIQFIKLHYAELGAVLSMHKDSIEKLQDLLTDRIILKVESFEDNLIEKAFRDEKLPDGEREEKIKNLFQKRAYNYEERKIQKDRDARVINRVIAVNNYIQQNAENDKDRKRIFICLTDAPTSIDVFKKIDGTLQEGDRPVFMEGGRTYRFPLYRSLKQVFAQLVCLVTTQDGKRNSRKTIEKLNALHKATSSFLKDFERFDEKESIVHEDKEGIFERYKSLRNEFENTGLFKSYSIYLDELKKDILGKDFQEVKDIITRISQGVESISTQLSDQDRQMVDMVEENSFNLAFQYGLRRIIDGGGNFVVKKGFDPVEGSYHHLPIVFWLEREEYRKVIHGIVDLVLARKTPHVAASKFAEGIKEQLRSLYKQVRSYTAEEKLIKAFICLILPLSDDSDNDNNMLAYNWIKSILESKSETLSPLLREEFLYLGSFAARRARHYHEALYLIEDALNNHKESSNSLTQARLLHGRFLVNYCILEEESKNNPVSEKIDKIDRIIKDAENAMHFYHKETRLPNDLVDKLDLTIINSLCYLYTSKFEYTSNHVFLEKARNEFLTVLKKREKNYNQFAEYLDTESYLVYWEAETIKQKNRRAALEKINKAHDTIIQAIDISNHPQLEEKYRKRKDDIEKLKEALEQGV